MARLSSGSRAKLPGRDFAGPGRSFPVEDAAHARAALRLVGRAVAAGHITSAQADAIRSMARAKLGKGK